MSNFPNLAQLCSALSNPRRVAIFEYILARPTSGRNFGEIVAHTGIPASSLAHHLKEMQAGGLVQKETQGAASIFTLNLPYLTSVLSHLMTECCRAEDIIEQDRI